jgi:hypothetical protein
MGVGEFGASAERASFQGFYGLGLPQADANGWVARAQWNCTTTLKPNTANVLQVTLTGGPQVPGEGGVDDANYFVVVQQFGRASVSIGVTYGTASGGAGPVDATNLIELTFGTDFVSNENLVAGMVYQTVPSINPTTGAYNPGGNP